MNFPPFLLCILLAILLIKLTSGNHKGWTIPKLFKCSWWRNLSSPLKLVTMSQSCCLEGVIMWFNFIISHLISSDQMLYLISSDVILFHRMSSDLIWSNLIWSNLILSNLIWSHLVSSDLIWFHLSSEVIWYHLISSVLTWSSLIWLYLIQSHLISFDLIWSHLIQSDPI